MREAERGDLSLRISSANAMLVPRMVGASGVDMQEVYSLLEEDARKRVVEHPLLGALSTQVVSKRHLAIVVGQYWHPIHYFTEFLASCVKTVGDMQLRSKVSLILYQELGQGNPDRAHERLYLEAVRRAGISPEKTTQSSPLPTTTALISGYEDSAQIRTRAIGYLFATEMIDLDLVQALGRALAAANGGSVSDWVRVHDREEQDHVEKAASVVASLHPDEFQEVRRHIVDAWLHWQAFCDGIRDIVEW